MSEHHEITAEDFALTRRDFLRRTGLGFGAYGFASLVGAGMPSAAADMAGTSMAPRAPHFAPKATRVIHIFMNGGMSHVDTFDPKPRLTELHGQKLPTDNLRTERPTGAAYK